ncbi:MAG: molybdopterin-synthase adenylyltransferase MoeB [Tetrasphaera sp.]|nr:molybdopterin-synthase adenylyltransferase MoeB [Tetrasphaera sp.]
MAATDSCDRGALSASEVTRYARHLLLPEVGRTGQERLRTARVLVVGAGGLGSPVLLYLAAAGVGTLGILDDDTVELTNLQRQIVHGTSDVGRSKVASAADRVADTNPHVDIVRHEERLTPASAHRLLTAYDIVVDGADNFATRYAVGAAAAELGIPHVWGSVYRFDGQVSVWAPPAGPCYACVFPSPPPPELAPSCSVGGVLGAVCASIGSVLATEVVKLITGIGQPLIGRLLVHDALAMTWASVPVRRARDCAVCRSRRPSAALDVGADDGADEDGAARSQPSTTPGDQVPEISATDLARALTGGALLLDVREQAERDIVAIPGGAPFPLADLRGGALPPMDPGAVVHVYCKSGSRSAEAVRLLRSAGVDAVSVRGGVLAWVAEVDPTLPTY